MGPKPLTARRESPSLRAITARAPVSRKGFLAAALSLLSATALGGCSWGAPAQKDLASYSWEELARMAQALSAAKDAQSAATIARGYGLVDDEGNLATTPRPVTIDGVEVPFGLVGILHDPKADGSGMAGLTFAALAAADTSSYGDVPAESWVDSVARTHLAENILPGLPDGLPQLIVSVRKAYRSDGGALESCEDSLWLLSDGEIGLNARPDLPATGTLYEGFAQDPSYERTWKGTPEPWWTRDGLLVGYSGTPQLTEPAALVPAFCL